MTAAGCLNSQQFLRFRVWAEGVEGTRKPEWSKGHRGFESHPLRHIPFKHSQLEGRRFLHPDTPYATWRRVGISEIRSLPSDRPPPGRTEGVGVRRGGGECLGGGSSHYFMPLYPWTLSTDVGDIDLLGEVAGLGAYDDVEDSSITVEVFGRPQLVLTLYALIASKQAAGRPKDLRMLPELEALREVAEG